MAAADQVFYLFSNEIFSKLPAKAILRIRSFSDPILSFLFDDWFAKQQALTMNKLNDMSFIVQQEPHFFSHHTLLPEYDNDVGIPNNSLKYLSENTSILASSGGLLFCKKKAGNYVSNEAFLICNPATQTMMTIPAPDSSLIWENNMLYKVIFECDSKLGGDDFLLMIIIDEDGDWPTTFKSMIYNHETREWKFVGRDINLGSRNLINKNNVYYDKGVVHYLSDFNCSYLQSNRSFYFPYIVAYNIMNSTTTFLNLPKRARKGRNHFTCQMGIFQWGNNKEEGQNCRLCLVKIRKDMINVWVTKNYENSSWTHILKKRAMDIGLTEFGSKVSDFRVINGNTLLIAFNKQIYSYCLNMDDEKAKKICMLEDESYRMVMYSYSNTLRPLQNSVMF
ncbi:uncharacterized protein LOC124929885 [Impatiens glandulifera]|uniref:uncharacterized protein LOC124929885 n=1 Tax=Impatiens glandulifera TaxID=253017 RepID=UPI001FB0F672|nr:uncharacterized protein LOC124929885 [Impatiens glandulifera]